MWDSEPRGVNHEVIPEEQVDVDRAVAVGLAVGIAFVRPSHFALDALGMFQQFEGLQFRLEGDDRIGEAIGGFKPPGLAFHVTRLTQNGAVGGEPSGGFPQQCAAVAQIAAQSDEYHQSGRMSIVSPYTPN